MKNKKAPLANNILYFSFKKFPVATHSIAFVFKQDENIQQHTLIDTRVGAYLRYDTVSGNRCRRQSIVFYYKRMRHPESPQLSTSGRPDASASVQGVVRATATTFSSCPLKLLSVFAKRNSMKDGIVNMCDVATPFSCQPVWVSFHRQVVFTCWMDL